MRNFVLIIVTLFFAQSLYAGDAGYMSISCHTKSKRTVLTILEKYVGFETYQIYTLIVDGFPMVMDSREDNVRMENNGDKNISVYVNDELALDMLSNSISIHKDPRKGTIAEYDATPAPWSTTLTCKTYFPEP